MSRLPNLRRALEDADIKDEPVVIKGPISDAFTETLQKIYAKTDENSNSDNNVATESAANDALAMQQLANAATNAGQHNLPATVVYAVNADAVTPDDVVAITTDMINQDPNREFSYAIVTNATTPTAMAGAGGDTTEMIDTSPSALNKALESIAEHYGVKIYPSLEAFAADRYK
jgi:hypothetical protein